MPTLSNYWGSLTGKIGKGIDVVGKALGNPFPELGLSEKAQYLGSQLNPVKTAYATEAPYSGPGAMSSGTVGGMSGTYNPSTQTATGGGGNVLGQQTMGGGGQDPYAGMDEQARNQAQIDLENALSEFDYYSQNAQAQRGALGQQKETSLSSMGNALGQSRTEAGTATTEATTATQRAKAKALGTAQDVQKQNRNVLRALGILSSSAAGEMLNKPMNEYGTQSADLEQNLVQRKNVVESWLQQRVAEHQTAVDQLEQQYGQLTDQIDRDLRFNDTQRASAVKAASAALQQRLGEIENSKVQYQQAAQQYNTNILSQIAQLQLYQNPQANVSGILSTMLGQVGGGNTSQAELSTFQKKKTLSGQ